jgi:hypothetical protein
MLFPLQKFSLATVSLTFLATVSVSVWGGYFNGNHRNASSHAPSTGSVGSQVPTTFAKSAPVPNASTTHYAPSLQSFRGLSKLDGTVLSLNTTAKTFLIGGLTVSYRQVGQILPSAAEISVGKRVTVFADLPVQLNTLEAKTLVVRSEATHSPELARMMGRISSLDTGAKSFILGGMRIDIASATLIHGTASDLSNGRKLKVFGHFSNSEMVASEVHFVRDPRDAVARSKNHSNDFAAAEGSTQPVI